MFFCPKCNNFYDITKNLPKLDNITGGAINNDYELIINKIISGDPLTKDEQKELDDGLLNSAQFKKLVGEVKELVYNKVMDAMPKKAKKLDKKGPICYFICKNCGHSEEISPKTLIFSKSGSGEGDTEAFENDFKSMIHAKYLPRTRHYICPNSKCISHDKHDKREAVFFRKPNSYKTVYVCTACETGFT
jgi:hypothetical protein